MDRPAAFGEFLLFQEQESKPYGTSYRAGVCHGKIIDRIVRLEQFDGDQIDPDQLRQGLEQARDVQQLLTDPHIAQGAGVGSHEGVPFAAYDFELGVSLSTFLAIARQKRFPIPFDQALFVIERVALALSAAYQTRHQGRPIVHSFLSPHSILLSNRGDVKVLGFEVGAALRQQLRGHPAYSSYLAPEVRAGEPAADNDDVFGLGSLLYELVTGSPLVGEAHDLEHVVVQATGQKAPESLNRLLEGSLAPRGSRLQSVLAWQQSLGKLILDGEYNPTTFNLAFLLHTLLRETLEQDVESLKRERALVLASPERTEVVTTEIAIDRIESSNEVATEVSTASKVSRSTVELIVGKGPERRPFWLGFGLSAMAAGALLAVFASRSPAETETATSDIEQVTDPITQSATAASSPQEKTEPAEEVLTEPASGQSAVVQTTVVNGGIAQAEIDEQAVDRLVAERAQEIEDTLKADYERELAKLRSQMNNRTPQPVDTVSRDSVRPQAEPEPREVQPPTPREQEEQAVLDPPPDEVSEAQPPTTGPLTTVSRPLAPADLDAGGLGSEAPTPAVSEQSPPEPLPASTPTPARLLRLGTPVYPPGARRLGLSQKVRVKVLVNPKGRVEDAEIIGTEVGYGFDAAALAAVRRSRWKPSTEDGRPVAAWNVLTIEFQP